MRSEDTSLNSQIYRITVTSPGASAQPIEVLVYSNFSDTEKEREQRAEMLDTANVSGWIWFDDTATVDKVREVISEAILSYLEGLS